MAGFGFTPDDPDNSGNPDFEAMMRQMQEQMKAQFEQLGINPVGFVNPFTTLFSQAGKSGTGKEEVLPLATARDTARKFVTAQGLKPITTKELAVVESAFQISEVWLNEALSFPATNTAPTSATRLDWVDQTMTGWHKTIEPLAAGLSSAISELLDQAMQAQAGETPDGQPPIEMITTMLRSFISTMIATQLGQSIGTLATRKPSWFGTAYSLTTSWKLWHLDNQSSVYAADYCNARSHTLSLEVGLLSPATR